MNPSYFTNSITTKLHMSGQQLVANGISLSVCCFSW